MMDVMETASECMRVRVDEAMKELRDEWRAGPIPPVQRGSRRMEGRMEG